MHSSVLCVQTVTVYVCNGLVAQQTLDVSCSKDTGNPLCLIITCTIEGANSNSNSNSNSRVYDGTHTL